MYAVSSEIAPPRSNTISIPGGRVPRIHPAWFVAVVAFLALVGAASFRAAPSILIDPLHDDFGWSRASISAAVSVNLVLYGLTAPFAAALMERFGMRRVVAAALTLVALGSGLTVFMTTTWQLILLWGVLVGLGTGSMALAFVATVVDRWFVARRGLVTGILTAGGAAGQLVFLPALAALSERYDWRTVSLTVAVAALAVVPLVLVFLRDRPEEVGVPPLGAPADYVRPQPPSASGGAVGRALGVLRSAARTRVFWLLAGTFAICGASTNGLVGTHFVPAAHDHGMPVTAAAGLLAVIGIFDLVGTIASGWFTDRFDSRKLLGIYYLLRGLSLMVLPILFASLRGDGAPADDRVHHLLRARLGGDRAADRRTVPQALRRRRPHRLRVGARVAPDRRRARRVPGRRRPGPARRLRRGVLRRGRPVRGRGRDGTRDHDIIGP